MVCLAVLGSKRFGDRVAMMQTSVAGEIATYEYDCKGTSCREGMLTDSSDMNVTLAEAASNR